MFRSFKVKKKIRFRKKEGEEWKYNGKEALRLGMKISRNGPTLNFNMPYPAVYRVRRKCHLMSSDFCTTLYNNINMCVCVCVCVRQPTGTAALRPT
jgi:hypothetical protein